LVDAYLRRCLKLKLPEIMKELILVRSGMAKVATVADNQCRDKGWTDYDYTLKVHASCKLDKDGFIIDHSILHAAIMQAFTSMGSCEELCMSIEHHVRLALLLHSVECRKIFVRIKPVNGLAYVEYSAKYPLKEKKPNLEFTSNKK
jgi:hypothetical protein